ncbi:DUF3822 family protein [Flavobacterium capsici]|uniref:DUF3822 family protein n=1 Tax=Flavobacterium capsici TaxID=3075618 RepID=A0AA96F465_9FLAO|nr:MULTISPECIES: DUF3822 family protein [unclassified Flavobacterium]WNM18406.1 DUF3822 family protein [Flavobacterium sp. PMR2A8]WNM22457.1 DUF3822 family protein [Flavobacterium sp. PMTSA4]
MYQNTSITNKTYKKLVIQVSLNGLSFACFDTISNKAQTFEKIPMGNFQKNTPIEELFGEAFIKYPELKAGYDDVLIIHSNNLSTFVPTALFDEEYIGSYLQFNTKVFETDFFTFDAIDNYEMNNVYIPYVNMNNYFIDQFGTFDYKHANSILVEKLLDKSRNSFDRKMFVHVAETHFEIVVIKNQKLELYNSFEYKTPEDFIYYVLFTAEQLYLNPENFNLEFLGTIDEESILFKIAYKYIRNVSLMEVDTNNSSFSEKQLREHFILLNS